MICPFCDKEIEKIEFVSHYDFCDNMSTDLIRREYVNDLVTVDVFDTHLNILINTITGIVSYNFFIEDIENLHDILSRWIDSKNRKSGLPVPHSTFVRLDGEE